MSAPRPVFIDAGTAAELLGESPGQVLEWIAEGKLASYGGHDRNPFVRMAHVEKLANTLGRELVEPGAKRRASQNPVRRIELRLRHDTRWSEVTPDDIAAWAKGLDAATRAASRTVAEVSVEKLQIVLKSLRELDSK